MQKPPTVTDYRGHCRSLFPVREINLKAYADAILTQITWPALGIEPRAMYRQPFKPAMYCAKPQGCLYSMADMAVWQMINLKYEEFFSIGNGKCMALRLKLKHAKVE